MESERKITVINNPSIYLKPQLNVAAYCRVSTSHPGQLESLGNQINYYKRMINERFDWKLVGVYADIKSGKNTSSRAEFQRMLADCVDKKIDLIITKSISRFGRNTADTLAVIYKLRSLDVDILFETENIKASESSKAFLLSIIEAMAQAESEARSKNIKWGIQHGFENGTSKFYNRKCYGYHHDSDGNIIIDEYESSIVRRIFDLYINGYSLLAITRELKNQNIKSPTGKDNWSKGTIDTILSNEKYIGNVMVGKTYCNDFPYNERKINVGQCPKYIIDNNHDPIITEEQFNQVQQEKRRRSNVITDGITSRRKNTHYSMKSSTSNNDN